MSFKFGRSSEAMLTRIHPDLVKVARRALEISPYDFGINSSSVRDLETQKQLVAEGKSQTLKSRHIVVEPTDLSHAIDINVYDENGKITWEIGYFRKVAQAFVTAAIELGVQIELGCLWKSFVDGPHIQLPWNLYP